MRRERAASATVTSNVAFEGGGGAPVRGRRGEGTNHKAPRFFPSPLLPRAPSSPLPFSFPQPPPDGGAGAGDSGAVCAGDAGRRCAAYRCALARREAMILRFSSPMSGGGWGKEKGSGGWEREGGRRGKETWGLMVRSLASL